MRINRHDKQLDALLGKEVEIEFTDGCKSKGTLGWNEHFMPLQIQPQMYYLELHTEAYAFPYISFYKGHVKSIRAL